ncbi:TetR/AcrR family transcriptional regulator [Prauserella oleivorans]
MRADARRNYERLLVEATDLFARHGVDASLEDVAKAAGVGIGTLYRHFPSRDALIEALLRTRFDSLAATAEHLLRHPRPRRPCGSGPGVSPRRPRRSTGSSGTWRTR